MKSPLIGLDIGYLKVRAVSLRPSKVGYTVVSTAEVSRFDDMGERKPLSRALAEIDSKLPLKGEVTVGCSDLSTMVRFEHNDPIPADRLERLLHLELSQHAGGVGEDLAADAVLIPIGGDELIHCCGLAQAPQVHKLLAELRQNGTVADAVQLTPAAGANALLSLKESDDGSDEAEADSDAYDLLLDIGSRSTRMVLSRGHEFIACRQLTFGGDNFTEALAKARDLRFDQAEVLKCQSESRHVDSAIVAEASGHDDDAGDSGDAEDNIDFSDGEAGISGDDKPTISFDQDTGAESESERIEFESSDETPASADDSGDVINFEDDAGSAPSAAKDSPAASAPHMLGDDSIEEITFENTSAAPEGQTGGGDNTGTLHPSASTESFPGEGSSGSKSALGPLTALFQEEADAVAAAPAPASKGDKEKWERQTQGLSFEPAKPQSPSRSTAVMGALGLGAELMQAAEALYVQVAKTQTWFQAQLRVRNIKVRRVRVVGGGANLAGLCPYLERRFKVPVGVFSPFEGMVGNQPENGHEFNQALGLALSPAPDAVNFDLRPESVLRKALWKREVLGPWIAAALVLLSAILAVVGIYLRQANYDENIEKYRNNKASYDRKMAQLRKAKAENLGLRQDMREVSSRLFGARTMLYAMRVLKENAPKELWLTSVETRGLHGLEEDARDKDAAAPIDRGLVEVAGEIKADAGQDVLDLLDIRNKWRDKVEYWQIPGTNPPRRLFRSSDKDPVWITDADDIKEERRKSKRKGSDEEATGDTGITEAIFVFSFEFADDLTHEDMDQIEQQEGDR